MLIDDLIVCALRSRHRHNLLKHCSCHPSGNQNAGVPCKLSEYPSSPASHFVGASQFWQMGASAEDADTMLAVATQLQAKHKHSYFVIVAPPRASGTAAAPQAFDPDIMLQLQTKLPRGDTRLLLASDMIEAVRTIPKLLQVGGALGATATTTSSHIDTHCGRKRQQSACAPDRRTQVQNTLRLTLAFELC